MLVSVKPCELADTLTLFLMTSYLARRLFMGSFRKSKRRSLCCRISKSATMYFFLFSRYFLRRSLE